MARFCGKCGAPILPDSQFCEECGEPVPVEAPLPVTPPPSPTKAPASTMPPPSGKQPETGIPAAKKPLPMTIIGIAAVVIVIVIAAIILFSGVLSTEPSNESTNAATPSPTMTFSLQPDPVGPIPAGNEVAIQVSRDPYSGMITALFAGGPGQKTVRSIEITVMRQDGARVSGTIEPVLLSEVNLQGTRRGTDRVIATVTYESGESYRVVDRQFGFND